MSFEMTRNLAFMFRTTDGGTVIAAQKESFSAGLETEYWSRIGREAWGDNNFENDTVTRPENGVEPDQNPTRTRPEKGTESDQNPTNANSIIWQDFPASCHQVYEALRQDAYLTYRGMVAKLGLNKDTINTAVGTLVRKGIIRRVGPKKGGHWEVMP